MIGTSRSEARSPKSNIKGSYATYDQRSVALFPFIHTKNKDLIKSVKGARNMQRLGNSLIQTIKTIPLKNHNPSRWLYNIQTRSGAKNNMTMFFCSVVLQRLFSFNPSNSGFVSWNLMLVESRSSFLDAGCSVFSLQL